MKEGKGAADAYAASIRNAPALITGNALAESQRLLDAAKAKVAAGPQGGGDATAQSREARQNLNELAAAQAAYDKVFANHEKVVADVTKANIEASEQAVGKSWVKNAESAQKLNEQLQAIKESGDAAKKSLETNTFAAGLSPTAVEATRKRLQTLVDQRDKTAGLLANQLSINATTEELQTRKAQIDATLESYTPAETAARTQKRYVDNQKKLDDSRIKGLVEAQQFEIQLLESKHSNHLISEDEFQKNWLQSTRRMRRRLKRAMEQVLLDLLNWLGLHREIRKYKLIDYFKMSGMPITNTRVIGPCDSKKLLIVI